MSTETGAPERCDECGFDYASVPAEHVPGRLRGFAPLYRAAVAEVPDVRRRPAPHTWSALEYACPQTPSQRGSSPPPPLR